MVSHSRIRQFARYCIWAPHGIIYGCGIARATNSAEMSEPGKVAPEFLYDSGLPITVGGLLLIFSYIRYDTTMCYIHPLLGSV